MAAGTAVLFRAELFRRVGLFDAAFESYLEDADFGLRCAAAGLEGMYVPEAVAYHQGSASLGAWTPQPVRLIARNQVFLLAKHYPGELIRRYWWAILAGQAAWGLLALRHGVGWAFVRGKMAGLWRFRSMRGIPASDGLAEILERGEREIAEAQRRMGADWYWSVYFLLTSRRIDT